MPFWKIIVSINKKFLGKYSTWEYEFNVGIFFHPKILKIIIIKIKIIFKNTRFLREIQLLIDKIITRHWIYYYIACMKTYTVSATPTNIGQYINMLHIAGTDNSHWPDLLLRCPYSGLYKHRIKPVWLDRPFESAYIFALQSNVNMRDMNPEAVYTILYIIYNMCVCICSDVVIAARRHMKLFTSYGAVGI